VESDGRGRVGKSDTGNLIGTKRGAQQLRVCSVALHRADGCLIRIIGVVVKSEPNQVLKGYRRIGESGRNLKQVDVRAGTATTRIRYVARGGGDIVIRAQHLLGITEIGNREQFRGTKQIPRVRTAINSYVRAMPNGSGRKSGDGIKNQNKDHKN
jgi:hypothetical protein